MSTKHIRNRHPQRRNPNNNHRPDKRPTRQTPEQVLKKPPKLTEKKKPGFDFFRLFRILFSNLIFGVLVYELNPIMNSILMIIIIDAR